MKSTALRQMILQFEAGTYPKEQWSHYAHFTMALWYCYHLPLPKAIRSIKDGIRNYNLRVGGQNTDEAGYHETITVFYTLQIIHFIAQSDDVDDLENLLIQLDQQPFLTKNYPLQFYSKELLMSKEARKRWVEPDLMHVSFAQFSPVI